MKNADKQKKRKKPFRTFGIFISLGTSLSAGFFVGMDSALSCLGNTVSIILAVILGSLVMAIMEYFNLFNKVSFLVAPLIKFSRLPELTGAVFSVAIFSKTAANAMLADSYHRNIINRKEMILSSMSSSYPSMVLNYFQIMFPVIGAIGIAGIIYFSIVNAIGILITLLILIYSRILLSRSDTDKIQQPSEEKRASAETVIKHFIKRTTMLVSRIFFITVPLYLLTALAARHGFFEFLQKAFPETLRAYLTPEIMTVSFARMGSIFGAAGVASELMRGNQITLLSVIFAFLLGNLLSMPLRFIRKSLPSTLGIFPGRDGLIIASGVQAMRIFFIGAALFIILPFLNK